VTRLQSRGIISQLSPDGSLQVRLVQEEITSPGPAEVIICIDAAPIHPADVKTLFCGIGQDALEPVILEGVNGVIGRLAPERLPEFAGRLGVPIRVGNEGTGVVIATGDHPGAQALKGCRVSAASGGMFSTYRKVPFEDCMVLPADTPVELAAAAWINPMTALAMVETMHSEGHSGLVLTAAASNLGQMLHRLCRHDAVPLVNIVRSEAQLALLHTQGAEHALNSTSADFDLALRDALAKSGATLAFDATGGGNLAGRILRAMEYSAPRSAQAYSRYGTAIHKQLYFFGGLDPAAVTFQRDFGMAWGMGGWLLQTALARFGVERSNAIKMRVRDQLAQLFASSFHKQIALSDMLAAEHYGVFTRLATGQKFLVRPS